jgi:hypothetical protein
MREQSDCRSLGCDCAFKVRKRAVLKRTPEVCDRADLPATRAAALRKWLRAANSRLLLLEHDRKQLLAIAAMLADALGQRSRRPRQKRGKLAARLARAG